MIFTHHIYTARYIEDIEHPKVVDLYDVISFAARGIKGKHFLVADEPEEMAEKILNLLDDSGKREYIGSQARYLIEREYNWTRVGEKFLREIERLI